MSTITRLDTNPQYPYHNPRSTPLKQQVPPFPCLRWSVQKASSLNLALLALTHHSPVTMVIIHITLAIAAPGNDTMKAGSQSLY